MDSYRFGHSRVITALCRSASADIAMKIVRYDQMQAAASVEFSLAERPGAFVRLDSFGTFRR